MTPLEKLKFNVRAAFGETPFVISKAILRRQHPGMSDGEFEKTWQISTEEYRWQFLVGVCDGLKGRAASTSRAISVSAGSFRLEIPSNGVAVLYEADAEGEHQLPGGVFYLEALVEFARRVAELEEALRAWANE